MKRRRRLTGLAVGATLVGLGGAALAAEQAAAITADDTITTYAGTGAAASSGDGGPATAAGVNFPVGIAITADGTLIVPEPESNRVRAVAPNGTIVTLAGTGLAGYSGDGGAATAAQLNYPVDATVDGSGNVYIADRDNDVIRRVTPAGVITTVAGSGVRGFAGDGGPAGGAQFDNPVGVVASPSGELFIADALNRRVRRVDGAGTITTVVGTGVAGSEGDGGPATAANLMRPDDVRFDGLGNLYIVDSAGHRVRRVAPDGIISTIAGTGVPGSTGDGGPATAAQLASPVEMAVDPFNNLYIADTNGHRLRRVSPAGVITTIAGTGAPGFGGDGGRAGAAQLSTPSGAALNAAGDLFIADAGNNRVRVVTNPRPTPTTPGVGRLEIPAGSAACNPVRTRSQGTGNPDRIRLTPAQLLINQRISQAAVRRVNGVQQWLDAKLATNDLCGGAFVAQSFAPAITVGATSAVVPEASQRPRPRPVQVAPARKGNPAAVRLDAAQLLINQRISQAAVRRVNALNERLEAGLTGGDLRSGVVTPAKLASGLTIAAAAEGPEPAPSRTVVDPPQRRGGATSVTLSRRQLLINQRVAQAAVRRSNALVDRLAAGFSAGDFRGATVTRRGLAPELRR